MRPRVAALVFFGAAACGHGVLAQEMPIQIHAGATASLSRSAIDGTTVRGDGAFGSNASQESAAVRDPAAGLGVFLGVSKRLDAGIRVEVEADLARLDHGSTQTQLIGGGAFGGQPSASLRYGSRWLGTLRLTAGRTFGDTFVYAAGGMAVLSEEIRRTQYQANPATGSTEARFAETDGADRRGWVLGVGAQWTWRRAWSIRLEYLHARFGEEVFQFPDARGGAQAAFGTVQGRIAINETRMDVVRLGLRYAFGPGR